MFYKISSMTLLICIIVAMPENSYAEQVGTAVVNGQIVILDGNRTWRFKNEIEKNAAAVGCDVVKDIEICLKKLDGRHGKALVISLLCM